jgi:hypothetical protein
MVIVGKRMWNEILAPNWMRESRSVSTESSAFQNYCLTMGIYAFGCGVKGLATIGAVCVRVAKCPHPYVFSPRIWWIGLRMSLSGSDVQILQIYSQRVRPLRVFSLRAKL